MTISWSRIDSFEQNSADPRTGFERACPVCRSKAHRVLLTLKDFQFFSDSAQQPKRMDLVQVQCRDCFTNYLNPGYSEFGFATLFAEAGCSYGATSVRSGEQKHWLEERGLLEPGSRLLDIGCYDGKFLSELPDTIERLGFDIDLPAIERGRAKYAQQGIRFLHGSFESFRPEHAPDVMTMYHVLEHLPDPLAALKNLRAFSHEETALVLEVPILEQGQTNDINGFFSAQHMTHFSRRSLENMLRLSGWEIADALQQQDYNGYRVLARPCPSQSAVSPDPEDLDRTLVYLSGWHEVVRSVNERLKAISAEDRLVIWGGGMHLEFLYQTTGLFCTGSQRPCIIVDSDPMKQGKSWRGVWILSPEMLLDVDWSNTSLLVSSYGGQSAIRSDAISRRVPSEKIVTLYDSVKVY